VPAKPTEDDLDRLSKNVDDPVEDEELEIPSPPSSTENTRAGRRRPSPSSRRTDGAEPGTATVYLSESVAKRLDEYRRKKPGRTNRDAILEAISANHERLAEVIEGSKVSTEPTSSLFPADPRKVRYLGGGKVQAQFTPTPQQAKVLDDLSEQLGFSTRSTWIAPVLNEFLPGRKETP
jgi:hypothetical protein